jgi:(2Fe-2S) ferredoxin
MTLTVGKDQSESAGVLGVVAGEAMANAASAEPVDGIKPSLGKPGWQNPPAFKHHILVCTGPRCHFRDAANLKLALAESLTAAGLSSDCLTATTGCLYPCNQGPMLAVYPRGEWYRLETRPEVDRFVDGVIGKGVTQPDLLIHMVQPIT